jgi:hypothetical protein
VEATGAIKGLVVFHAGYEPTELQQVFYGYAESAFAIDAKQQRVFCRELSASLSSLMPLALRNATMSQVLIDVAKATGLKFITPDADYAKKTAPAFYSLGSGYACLDSLAETFSIPKFIWQQQGDGRIYAGSWDNSFWADKKIALTTDMQTSSGLANSAKIPCLPRLRPGVLLDAKGYVTNVNWVGEHQVIEWDSNPWGTRWTNRSSV